MSASFKTSLAAAAPAEGKIKKKRQYRGTQTINPFGLCALQLLFHHSSFNETHTASNRTQSAFATRSSAEESIPSPA
jgi:hypothetical protein